MLIAISPRLMLTVAGVIALVVVAALCIGRRVCHPEDPEELATAAAGAGHQQPGCRSPAGGAARPRSIRLRCAARSTRSQAIERIHTDQDSPADRFDVQCCLLSRVWCLAFPKRADPHRILIVDDHAVAR